MVQVRNSEGYAGSTIGGGNIGGGVGLSMSGLGNIAEAFSLTR